MRAGNAGLLFDADFEAGNIGSVRSISDFEYEISLRPDTNAPRYRLWYFFRVRFDPHRNVFIDQAHGGATPQTHRVVFSIINFSKSRSLYRDGMTPLVRSTSRPHWERLPRKQVFYFRSTKQHSHGARSNSSNSSFMCSFVFTFDRPEDEYFFAYSFPFTYTEQQRQLAEMEAMQLPYVRRDLLCRSVQGRRVDVVTIGGDGCISTGGGDGASGGAPISEIHATAEGRALAAHRQTAPGHEQQARRRTVVVVGRVHPGETPSSFVIRGLLEFLTSPTDRDAERLRREVTFVIVPMLNPDGVFLGNYRTCSLGIDHNRRWAHPTQAMEPSLLAVKRLLTDLCSSRSLRVDYFVDVHAHSTARSGFVLCNPPPRHLSSGNSAFGGRGGAQALSGRGGSHVLGAAADTTPEMLRAIHLTEISAWPRLLAGSLKEFSLHACKLCTDPSKSGCARRVLGTDFPDVVCYTLEISFYASIINSGSTLSSQLYKPVPGTQVQKADHYSTSVADTHGGTQSGPAGGSAGCCPNSERGLLEFGRQVGLSFMSYYKIPRAKLRRASTGSFER